MPRVPQVATLLQNLGPRQREVALNQIDIILSLRSLVHITSEIEIPDEKTMRCFLPPMTVPVVWVRNFAHFDSRF